MASCKRDCELTVDNGPAGALVDVVLRRLLPKHALKLERKSLSEARARHTSACSGSATNARDTIAAMTAQHTPSCSPAPRRPCRREETTRRPANEFGVTFEIAASSAKFTSISPSSAGRKRQNTWMALRTRSSVHRNIVRDQSEDCDADCGRDWAYPLASSWLRS